MEKKRRTRRVSARPEDGGAEVVRVGPGEGGVVEHGGAEDGGGFEPCQASMLAKSAASRARRRARIFALSFLILFWITCTGSQLRDTVYFYATYMVFDSNNVR